MPAWLIILLAYLLGAIPTAYIAGRILAGKDIRRIGDENAGAANVYRELGPAAGIIVGVIDAGKGALAVIIAQAASMSQIVVVSAGAAAVAGQILPVFNGFKGGRGVSTTLGVLLVLVTLPALILAIPSLLILIWRKNVTPALAFFYILLPVLDWLFKMPFAYIAIGIILPAASGITTLFRTRPKAIHEA